MLQKAAQEILTAGYLAGYMEKEALTFAENLGIIGVGTGVGAGAGALGGADNKKSKSALYGGTRGLGTTSGALLGKTLGGVAGGLGLGIPAAFILALLRKKNAGQASDNASHRLIRSITNIGKGAGQAIGTGVGGYAGWKLSKKPAEALVGTWADLSGTK